MEDYITFTMDVIDNLKVLSKSSRSRPYSDSSLNSERSLRDIMGPYYQEPKLVRLNLNNDYEKEDLEEFKLVAKELDSNPEDLYLYKSEDNFNINLVEKSSRLIRPLKDYKSSSRGESLTLRDYKGIPIVISHYADLGGSVSTIYSKDKISVPENK